MQVEAKLRREEKNGYTILLVDTYVDGDNTVVTGKALLMAPSECFSECDLEKDTFAEIVKKIKATPWYQRGERGRVAADRRENIRLFGGTISTRHPGTP